ncbi:hypothetical protein RRG08_025566 [Elysia crispata]|uniref:Uncharacterized protein n=1 Tax=Elysia crispata TaxID=231223 RepID=A0AAE0YXF3_9GAST|nr:hypothetical protein RRG08_025566 [Elysia crispata]
MEVLSTFDSLTQHFLDNQNNVTDAPLTTARNIKQNQEVLQKELLENLAEAINGIFKSSENTSKVLTYFFASLEGNIQ